MYVPTHREGRKELGINGSSDLVDLGSFTEDSQIDWGGGGGRVKQERFSNFSNNQFFQAEKLLEKPCQQGRIL